MTTNGQLKNHNIEFQYILFHLKDLLIHDLQFLQDEEEKVISHCEDFLMTNDFFLMTIFNKHDFPESVLRS